MLVTKQFWLPVDFHGMDKYAHISQNIILSVPQK